MLNGQHVNLIDGIIREGRFRCRFEDGTIRNVKLNNLKKIQVTTGDEDEDELYGSVQMLQHLYGVDGVRTSDDAGDVSESEPGGAFSGVVSMSTAIVMFLESMMI